MKRLIALLITLTFAIMATAQNLTPVSFMPAWTPQSQFAGYYAALENGFYREEGLDVSISHIGQNSTRNPIDYLKKGKVDFIVSNPVMILTDMDSTQALVNVLQLAQKSALCIVSRIPVSKIADLDGKKVARWLNGYGLIPELMFRAGGSTAQWIPAITGTNLFISGAVDAVTCMTFNEYLSILESRGRIPDENVFFLSDHGYNLPEEGLYARDEYVQKHPEIVQAFCRASAKGWLWCQEHKEEAIELVMKYTVADKIMTNRYHQKYMLEEMFNLMTNPESGKVDFKKLDKSAFDEVVNLLHDAGFISRITEYNEFCR